MKTTCTEQIKKNDARKIEINVYSSEFSNPSNNSLFSAA
jgi:hypothetical protein